MKRRKRKSILTALALVILSGIASVGSTFAWWNVVNTNHNVQITVGDRITLAVNTQDAIVGGEHLVPSDVPLMSDQVHKVTTTIKLKVTGTVDLSLLKLEVSEESRSFIEDGEQNNNSTLASFFVVKVGNALEEVTTGNPVTINTVTEDIDVNIEFTLVVPVDQRNEPTASALAKGVFEITLGFVLLEK